MNNNNQQIVKISLVLYFYYLLNMNFLLDEWITSSESGRRPPSQILTVANNQFKNVEASGNLAWYREHLRVTRSSFDQIVALIKEKHSKKSYWNEKHDFRAQVAAALHYLTHESGAAATGSVFGMSQSSVHRYVDQFIAAALKWKEIVIKFPTTENEWEKISAGFESICGMPFVVGAIDGTLVEIARPYEFHGWYCRKFYPALNVQGVVDDRKRFMHISCFSGSHNDKSMFNLSSFSSEIKNTPKGYFFIGDAGYKLTEQLLTPYPYSSTISEKELKYNYIHSRTRMKVESAYGQLKEKFRIFQCRLLHKSPEKMAEVIVTCAIVHNWLISMEDEDYCSPFQEVDANNDCPQRGSQQYQRVGESTNVGARKLRDFIKNHIWFL
jgi:hypothetical protein